MRLRLRLLLLLITSLFHKPVKELDQSVISLRVLPNDIDIFKITTDRYVALMELGRMDFAFRIGLLRTMIRKNWVPLTTLCTIRFRHPLKVFQKYQLRTRVAFWDEHTFYFQHDFELRGRVVATGYVCSTLLSPAGPVRPEDVLGETGVSMMSPEKPEIVARLMGLDAIIHQGQHEKDPIQSPT
ncbi:MAG: thioesterase family protein [Desulfuromonadales bacterium]|nr:thioesterase family protein [Desulfuromonadales bacterium]